MLANNLASHLSLLDPHAMINRLENEAGEKSPAPLKSLAAVVYLVHLLFAGWTDRPRPRRFFQRFITDHTHGVLCANHTVVTKCKDRPITTRTPSISWVSVYIFQFTHPLSFLQALFFGFTCTEWQSAAC